LRRVNDFSFFIFVDFYEVNLFQDETMISAYHFTYIIDSMTFVLFIDQLLHFLVDILLSLFLAGNQYLCPRH